MRRRTVRGAATAAAIAIAVVLSATASAGPASDSRAALAEFENIEGAYNYGGFKPASLSLDRKVKVILEVEGDSVGERMADARKRGTQLSKAGKAAIRAELERRQNPVEAKVEALGGETLADYQDAYNGVAARVAVEDLAALTSTPGVVRVHPVRIFRRPDNIPGAQYVRAHEAWNDTGFTGDGQRVAILDTGVDYTHADFGGPGTEEAFDSNDGTVIEPGSFPTAKVVGGFDFVGDDFSGPNEPSPDPDPLDCNGHGTHVAGTAAGFGVLSDGSTYTGPYNDDIYSTNSFTVGPGTAPEADILAVRVFGCTGFTTEEILVAALEFSLEQGADEVNMSLGSVFGRDEEPSVVASNTLADAGVAVVASAGNSGAGAYITGAPAIGNKVLSVAAIDASSPTFPGATVSLSTGETIVAQNSNDAEIPDGSLPVAVLRTSYPDGPVSLGCDPADYTGFPGGVEGKLVVTVRGVCARVARAIFGEQAGAAAVAMINTDAGYPPFEGPITSNPDTGEEFTVTIPFLGIRGVLGPAATDDGDKLVAADGGTATLAPTTVPNPGYQRLAGFTSGGPANVDSDQKPEVTAPGVSVLSANIGSGDGGTRISGTSMAAPHTTGVAALVSQAHPTWPTEWIKAALINTANPTADKIAQTGANSYDPRRAGSGVIDARKAVDTVAFGTTGDGSGTLSYGYEPLNGAYSETRTLTLHNTGGSDVTYDLSVAFTGLSRGVDVSFSADPVTVPSGGTADVVVTLTLDAAEVAALPGATASNFGAIAHAVRGLVVADPTTSGSGVYTLRTPFMVVPRGLSNLTAGPRSPYRRAGGPNHQATIPLANSGIHSGTASLFAWNIQDSDDVSGFADDPMDIRSVGVQALPGSVLGGSASDRSLFFAINGYGRWSNASVNEFDVVIDSHGRPGPEFFVVGVDLGAVLAGAFNGQFASFIFDAAGNLVNAWVAQAPMNGSTVVLPTLASDIGLDSGSTKFSFSVNGFSLIPGVLVDTTDVGQFRSHQPPVSTGDSVTLAPGGTGAFTVNLHKGFFSGTPVLGWLVVTQDDANGGAQADTVSAQPVP